MISYWSSGFLTHLGDHDVTFEISSPLWVSIPICYMRGLATISLSAFPKLAFWCSVTLLRICAQDWLGELLFHWLETYSAHTHLSDDVHVSDSSVLSRSKHRY